MATTWAALGIDIPDSARGPVVYVTCPRCSEARKKKHAKCLSAYLLLQLHTGIKQYHLLIMQKRRNSLMKLA